MKMRVLSFAILLSALALPQLSKSEPFPNKSKRDTVEGQASTGESKKSAKAMPTNCDAGTAKFSPWDPQHLENNPNVLAAANGFVTQMVGNYNFALEQSKGKPLTADGVIAGSELPLVNALITAAITPSGPQQIQTTTTKAVQTCHAAVTTADTNKQTGAGPGSDGTTSTTELTGFPELLSIAIENGSVTNNISGTTMTLSTSLYGLLSGFHLLQDSSHNYTGCSFCVHIGASGTFNVASDSSPLTSTTRKDISQWELKYSFFDQSTRSTKVQDLWNSNIKEQLAPTSTNIQYKTIGQFASDLAAAATPTAEAALQEQNYLKKSIDDYVGSADIFGKSITPCILAIEAASSDSSSHSTCNLTLDPSQQQPATVEGLTTLILQGLDTDKGFQDEARKIAGKLENYDSEGLKSFAQKYQTTLTNYQNAVTEFEREVDNLSKGWNVDLTFGQQFPTTTSSPSSASATGSVIRTLRSDATGTASSSTANVPDYLTTGLDISWQPKTRCNSADSANKPTACKANDTPTTDVSNAPSPETNNAPPRGEPSVTFNEKASFYTNPNTALNEKSYRGMQTALQLQWTFGSGPFVGDANDKSKITLALNGSYQRLPENKDQSNKKPDIASGSAKLTIPFPSGISFPLAVTWGDSPQQKAKGNYVIGNFGISFDVDKLAALLPLKH